VSSTDVTHRYFYAFMNDCRVSTSLQYDPHPVVEARGRGAMIIDTLLTAIDV